MSGFASESLTALRARAAALDGEAALTALADALRGDSRAGARANNTSLAATCISSVGSLALELAPTTCPGRRRTSGVRSEIAERVPPSLIGVAPTLIFGSIISFLRYQ